MAKNKKNKKNKKNNTVYYEDYYDLRNSTKRPAKHKRVRDKKYLKDMMRGDIDIDSYHDYNGN